MGRGLLIKDLNKPLTTPSVSIHPALMICFLAKTGFGNQHSFLFKVFASLFIDLLAYLCIYLFHLFILGLGWDFREEVSQKNLSKCAR